MRPGKFVCRNMSSICRMDLNLSILWAARQRQLESGFFSTERKTDHLQIEIYRRAFFVLLLCLILYSSDSRVSAHNFQFFCEILQQRYSIVIRLFLGKMLNLLLYINLRDFSQDQESHFRTH
uniref:(northern house mosquito) hypothetical protein n=1 Tax=Culex pipiens TaxID=7175 RepID=A0A8D8GTE4_CULPI